MSGERRTIASLLLVAVLPACGMLPMGAKKEKATAAASASGSAAAAPPASARAAPLSTIQVDHGELDNEAPDDARMIAAITVASTVYAKPNVESEKLGYVRLGGKVKREPKSSKGGGCKGEWYRIFPTGYACTEEWTIDLEDPVVRAAHVRPALEKPLPYAYGFVRATAPQYLRVPTKKEQVKSEFKLLEHLQWYKEHEHEVQVVDLGSNDVPLDARGIAVPGLKQPEGFRPSTKLTRNELFGGNGDDKIPWWLDGGRKIPNVSAFKVPDYAVFADRVRRKTGLSFVGSFNTLDDDLERRFGITVDMRLIPTTKVKPGTGSTFHGIEIGENMPRPFAWVNRNDVHAYRLIKGKDEVRQAEALPRRAIVPITGEARIKARHRYYQLKRDPTRWVRHRDLGIVADPPEWPEFAEKGEKWVDISLRQQVLVLYEGKRPWYATLVSTGRDRLGDPKDSLATPQGTFRLQSKHVAAAMDSEENSSVSGGKKATKRRLDPEARATVKRLKAAKKAGKTLSKMDERRWKNVQKGRHPEYGVTMRRGSRNFELRDVPWIQYFSTGYALHGAYWHDVFGHPRSHGCVNLAPIDARLVFMWSDPPVPDGWHGINIGDTMGKGTAVYIHE